MNSKQKGARGEREFAAVCREHGYEARRGQQYNGIEGEDVIGLPGIHIEVKRVERLNIEEAMSQSIGDAQGNIPIVAHRKNNCEWLITMRAEDWFKLYRDWEVTNNDIKG
jgi:Holliday junction resolvase